MKDYVYTNTQQMSSARGKVASETYRAHKVGNRTWFEPVSGDASKIVLHDPSCEEGFGGSETDMRLESGEVVTVKGPWCSNADALKSQTGIDLTNNHLTFGFVADEIDYDWDKKTYTCRGVHHVDDCPTLGQFSRIDQIAKYHAKRLGRRVRVYSESQGGSSFGWEDP